MTDREEQNNIIIYKTKDSKVQIALYARDGQVWLNQKQLAQLFDTSRENITMHIKNILIDKELEEKSVCKDYLHTAQDGKNYNVTFYSLEMILYKDFDKKRKKIEAEQEDLKELEGIENKIKKSKK